MSHLRCSWSGERRWTAGPCWAQSLTHTVFPCQQKCTNHQRPSGEQHTTAPRESYWHKHEQNNKEENRYKNSPSMLLDFWLLSSSKRKSQSCLMRRSKCTWSDLLSSLHSGRGQSSKWFCNYSSVTITLVANRTGHPRAKKKKWMNSNCVCLNFLNCTKQETETSGETLCHK